MKRHKLVAKIGDLASQKRLTSIERKQYKKENTPDSNYIYERHFQNSDENRKELRRKIRFLHLANNFVKKTPYKRVEAKVHEENRLCSADCKEIHSVIEIYFPGEKTQQDIEDWVRGDGE
jgi:hypothetical protein